MFKNILIMVLTIALFGVSLGYVQLSKNCSAEIKELRDELGITGLKEESDARELKVETVTMDMVTITVRFDYIHPEAGDAAAYRTCLTDYASMRMRGLMFQDYMYGRPTISDFGDECGLHIRGITYTPQGIANLSDL